MFFFLLIVILFLPYWKSLLIWTVVSKMSDFHLTKGFSVPKYNGTLRLYNMTFCPYAQRAVLMLNAKNIPYEIVNVNLTEKPEWLTSKSPFGKVPALEVAEDVTIYESLVIAEYIDDKYPNPSLTSKDPLRRAQDKLIVENFGKCTMAFYKAVILNESDVDLLNEGLDFVNGELKKRSTKFLTGDRPGLVDYMIWPWFERFDLLALRGFKDLKMDGKKYPLLSSWMEAMKKDPAVKSCYLDVETHNKFYDLRSSGDVNCYNFLL